MREIKFRAWDKRQEAFIFPTNDETRFVHWPNQLPNFNVCYQWNIVLTQYTGLKDKNGKEIYEGDILESENWRGKVFFATDLACFYCETFKFPKSCYSDHQFPLCNSGSVQVVGNIYENVELLEDY